VADPHHSPSPGLVRGLKPAWLRVRPGIIKVIVIAIGAGLVIAAARVIPGSTPSPDPTHSMRYLGVYEPGAPDSYEGIDQFAHAIGRQPNLALYYSTWFEPFQAGFASLAAQHGAEPLVQMDAVNIPLASVADGQYDTYLRTFANEVKAYGGPVIMSFDHEMNGDWYRWGFGYTSARTFVAAWRHVVTIFRDQGATNVTWMWTINIIDTLDDHVAAPAPWWPGSQYVDWVGIDGYYYSPSTTFSTLFGPTIIDVRELTKDPILIAETGVARSAGQSAKLADMFAGVQAYGLLGLVLFNENGVKPTQGWRIVSPAVYATLREETRLYMKPLP
jgi:mannan endo-1,4-beta-mannosidase